MNMHSRRPHIPINEKYLKMNIKHASDMRVCGLLYGKLTQNAYETMIHNQRGHDTIEEKWKGKRQNIKK